MTRAALPEVLAAMTRTDDVGLWRAVKVTRADYRGVAFVGPRCVPGRAPWRHGDSAEAVEALASIGLVPATWADPERAPMWACPRCTRMMWQGDGPVICVCEGGRRGQMPMFMHELAAVAAAGLATLSAAEAVVAEAWPTARFVWRVERAVTLRSHHEFQHDTPPTAATIFSREAAMDGEVVGAFDLERMTMHYGADHRTAPAWPAVCAVRGLGLHLMACDAVRVVLAVESLP